MHACLHRRTAALRPAPAHGAARQVARQLSERHFVNEWSIDETPDSDYFVYGEKQSDIDFKSEFLEDFIAIGTYFPSDCLILNSRVQTPDGEFECILLGAAFSIRTLSFAAMMRALCVYECQDVDFYPPYEDTRMNSGIPALITSGR